MTRKGYLKRGKHRRLSFLLIKQTNTSIGNEFRVVLCSARSEFPVAKPLPLLQTHMHPHIQTTIYIIYISLPCLPVLTRFPVIALKIPWPRNPSLGNLGWLVTLICSYQSLNMHVHVHIYTQKLSIRIPPKSVFLKLIMNLLTLQKMVFSNYPIAFTYYNYINKKM